MRMRTCMCVLVRGRGGGDVVEDREGERGGGEGRRDVAEVNRRREQSETENKCCLASPRVSRCQPQTFLELRYISVLEFQ